MYCHGNKIKRIREYCTIELFVVALPDKLLVKSNMAKPDDYCQPENRDRGMGIESRMIQHRVGWVGMN